MKPGEFSRLCSGATALAMVILIDSACANPLIPTHDAAEHTSMNSYQYNDTTDGSSKNSTSTDDTPSGNSLSIMWYLVSFGGLVTFFLLLSFSEFCCKPKPMGLTPSVDTASEATTSDPPAPPPYELFAPPAYESLFRDITRDRKRSIRASVFLIPVHDKAELPLESPLEFGEVIRRNPMGDGEVVTPPPPP